MAIVKGEKVPMIINDQNFFLVKTAVSRKRRERAVRGRVAVFTKSDSNGLLGKITGMHLHVPA